MKKLLFSCILLVFCLRLSAQQDHHYTMFMYNKMLYNPAYAGTRGLPTMTGIFRSQWMGFEGAPQSALVSFNSPFLTPRVGVGVVVSHRTIGLERDLQASLAYSYELIKLKNLSVRAGIQGSIRSLSLNFADADPINPDPSIDNERLNDYLGNVGAGFYALIMDRFYLGASVPRIYSNTYGLQNPNANKLAKESPHLYATAGGIFPLSSDISLLPAVLIKYVEHAPIDADVNISLDIKQKVTAGMSYRIGGDGSGESVDLLVLWQASTQLGFGVSYDFSLSNLKDHNAGSIELLVQADLKKPKKKAVFSPRFLK
jgi:type IX secretion system PorP/SprF family membrane protein